MDTETFIAEKVEIYTFDELSFLKECEKSPFSVLEKLIQALKDEKEKCVVFFMPESSFKIFSVFQGDNSITSFSLQDASNLLTNVQSFSEKNPLQEKLKAHMEKKLSALYDFMQKGNGLVPVKIETDSESFKSLNLI